MPPCPLASYNATATTVNRQALGDADCGVQHHGRHLCKPSQHFDHDAYHSGGRHRCGWAHVVSINGTNFQPGAVALFVHRSRWTLRRELRCVRQESRLPV